MLQLAGYNIIKKICFTPYGEIWLGKKNEGANVIFKTALKNMNTFLKSKERLEHEAAILNKLGGSSLFSKPLDFIETDDEVVLVLEGYLEETLDDYIKNNPFDVKKFLTISINLAKELEYIHQKNIVHKDIKPLNIIISPKNLQIKFIDFGMATQLTSEKQENIINPILLEGTPSYISPEQTGRTNAVVDYRSDFYSLGVTLFELATNQLPFQTEDLLELVYYHIAKERPNARQTNPQIPALIANIILKLMAISPEDRYQSAYGLKIDLERALKEWESTGTISEFLLGQNECPNNLCFSQKFYGREEEIKELFSTLERASAGSKELILIAGHSGIGKTALVQEVIRPLTKHRGHFISAKFEELKHNKPLGMIIELFKNLIQQILAEPENEIIKWKNKIIKYVGHNAKILTDEILDLELIIGSQPPVPDLPPHESLNRLISTFESFIHVFTDENNPLLIFFDDLQWADKETLTLLQSLFTSGSTKYFLVIGTYRDNEVTLTHPMSLMTECLIKQGCSFKTLMLKPLSEKYIYDFINDSLYSPRKSLAPLIDIIFKKTGGNPYFIKEFIKSLYYKNMLFFDMKIHQWNWHLEQIKKSGYTKNIIYLKAQQIKCMDTISQQVLIYGACIGRHFTIKLLSKLLGYSVTQLANAILPCLRQELVYSNHDTYRLLEHNKLSELENNEYYFAHDHIQETAYSLLSENKKPPVHFQIGKCMLNQINIDQLSLNESVFDIVDHWNLSRQYVVSADDRKLLIELNFMAGKKARTSGAFDEAVHYLEISHDTLDEMDWKSNHQMALDTCLYLAECEFLIGNHDSANLHLDKLLQKVDSKIEKGHIYQLKIMFSNTEGTGHHTIELGLQALQLFGINIQQNASNQDIEIEYQEINHLLKQYSRKDLLNAPCITDANVIFTTQILVSIMPNAYDISKNFFATLVFRLLKIILQHGNAGFASAWAYQVWSFYLIIAREDYKRAYEYSKLSEEIKNKYASIENDAGFYMNIGSLIYPWIRPFTECLDAIAFGFKRSIATGSHLFAGYASAFYAVTKFLTGVSLPVLIDDIKKYLEFCTLKHLDDMYNVILLVWRLADVLGDTNFTFDFDEHKFQELIFKSTHTDPLPMDMFYLYKLITTYLMGDIKEAWEFCKESEIMFERNAGIATGADRALFSSLIAAAYYHQANDFDKKLCIDNINKNKNRLQKWAASCPENFQHRYFLVEAEEARIFGKYHDAEKYFEQAINYSKRIHSTLIQAVALELAGHLQKSKPDTMSDRLMRSYISDAYFTYLAYGANKKAKMLEEKYTFLESLNSNHFNVINKYSPTNISGFSVDAVALMHASVAISQEIELEKLIKTLLHILIEESGAQFISIIEINTIDNTNVIATSDIEGQNIFIDNPIPYTKFNLPISVIKYVLRTNKTVLVTHATQSEIFGDDPYIQKNNVHSILALPLIIKGILTKIIYFENNGPLNVFSENRIAFLENISSQIATSFENAKLYSNINQINQTYERFVPKEFCQLLDKNCILDIHLGDSVRKVISVLFCDIRNFTKRVEKMSPQKSFKFVNNWLQFIEPIIRRNHGFIDKYLGDAVMVIFPNKTDHAIQTAIELLLSLKQYNQFLISQEMEEMEIGIGINTGPTMLGFLGSYFRMEATVISDVVNTASRVQSLTKIVKATSLITEETKVSLDVSHHFDLRYVGSFSVRGKSAPTKLWEIFSSDDDDIKKEKYQTLAIFEKGVDLFEKGELSEAANQFKICLIDAPHDLVAKQYILRCAELANRKP